jgi:hypothetical protein
MLSRIKDRSEFDQMRRDMGPDAFNKHTIQRNCNICHKKTVYFCEGCTANKESGTVNYCDTERRCFYHDHVCVLR